MARRPAASCSSSPSRSPKLVLAAAAAAGELRRAACRLTGRLTIVALLLVAVLFLLSALVVHWRREAAVADAASVQRVARVDRDVGMFHRVMLGGGGGGGGGDVSLLSLPKDRARLPLREPRRSNERAPAAAVEQQGAAALVPARSATVAARSSSVVVHSASVAERSAAAATRSEVVAARASAAAASAVANAAAVRVNATASAAFDPATGVEPEGFVLLDAEKEQFVYSAHFDDRTSVVHIVGFKHRFKSSATRPLWCRYGHGGNATLHNMEVYFNVSVIYPKPGLLYNAFVWRCTVDPASARQPPRAVELVRGDGNPPVATLRIQYTPPPPPQSGSNDALPQFGVCVRPMVNYSNLHQLVEFVEVHRLFGVSKFIIYDYSHHSVIDEALKYYVTKGLVVLHRWPLPVPLEDVHADGQKAMNHHCLMTYMNVFKHIAFIDLDEILMPIAPARTWADIIAAARSSAGSRTTVGAYVLLSSIFPREIANFSGLDCASPKQPCKMATLVNRVHFEIYPAGVWSKPLVETRKTDLVDVHDVRRMMPSYTVLDVSSSVAFIHHYRSVTWASDELTDYGVEQFREDIVREVGTMFAMFSPSAVSAA